MQIDSSLQRLILEELKSANFGKIIDFNIDEDYERIKAHIHYLNEHGLLEANFQDTNSGPVFLGAKITAKGIDYLERDGGLTAVLGTITVRLHEDTIKELLLAQLEMAAVSSKDKSWIQEKLQSLSNESWKVIAQELVKKGIQNTPDIMNFLGNIIS
ncbi:hypothetical protein [Synechococcus elongatus]|uniref:hypothetical protein n=1 Tax=Synechococcus elongatus TaxID=32046 RepID=UPI0030D24A86